MYIYSTALFWRALDYPKETDTFCLMTNIMAIITFLGFDITLIFLTAVSA